ncbi:Mannosyltransferase [Paragonimus heterotremus]|uniref:Mannosyltransferase n=1 Tax=Paragonimus heterotremus TaxID=100268 RepID=A0A8J4WGW0_9TREM|nr:Mannosyltransferase [Paragonimus heterotremus]
MLLRSTVHILVHIFQAAPDLRQPQSNRTTYNGIELLNRIVFPVRLVTALGSIFVDLFILFASAYLRHPYSRGRRCFLSKSPPIALILYASATFGGLLFSGRTLANTWETIAVALFGLLFLGVMNRSQPMQSEASTINLVSVSLLLCMQAALSGWAIFLRFTYVVFVFPMVIIEVYSVLRKFRSSILIPSALCFLIMALTVHFCLLMDSAYFTGLDFLTLSTRFPVNDLICVPCRFFLYNSDSNSIAKHGLHPRFLHLLVNLPLMFGPAVPLLAFCAPLMLPSPICLTYWCSFVVPLALLSVVSHQETRFLLPLIPFVVLLSGCCLEVPNESTRTNFIYIVRKSKFGTLFILCWFVQQLFLLILFNNLHQGGLVSYYKSLPLHTRDLSDCPVHVFYHTYMPPRFPLGYLTQQTNFSDASNMCRTVIDLKGSSESELQHVLLQLRNRTEPCMKCRVVNLIYPGSLSPLNLDFDQFGSVITTKLFFGHLSFEDLPRFLLNVKNGKAMFADHINYWYSQLSLHVVTIGI